MGLVTLWAVFWGLSVYAFATGEAGTGGPGGGSPRMAAFLGWQMAALLPAFAAWAVGWQWPTEQRGPAGGAGATAAEPWPHRRGRAGFC